MLYDPKWEKKGETKPAVRSLAGFISWLETKPPEGLYSYCSPNVCAVAQYLREMGEKNACLFSDEVNAMLGDNRIVSESPNTFGAALLRAREFAAR